MILALAIVLVLAFLWLLGSFIESVPPRRVTLASGPANGLYHLHAQRYKEILGRSGISVEERMTAGSVENLALLERPDGADVAFVHGGLAAAGRSVSMLVTLYYEPLWILVRKDQSFDQVNELAGRTIATGRTGSGSAVAAARILAENGIAKDTALKPLGFDDGLRALKASEVDAVFTVGAATEGPLAAALHDPAIRSMSLKRTAAYARRFPHVTPLVLPAGTIDLRENVPSHDVHLIATKAMLVAKPDLHPGIIDVLIDAAREIHGDPGLFEQAGEFPGIAPVDLPVSPEAVRYFREGPTFLHRFFPFWVATFLERLLVYAVPMLVVLSPLLRWLPGLMRWRFEERVLEWYRALARLERSIREDRGTAHTERWLAEVDRIRRGSEQIAVPAEHAGKAYALRSHVLIVQKSIDAYAHAAVPDGPAKASMPNVVQDAPAS